MIKLVYIPKYPYQQTKFIMMAASKIQSSPRLCIHSDRMLTSFNELAKIGATAKGGVHRPAFSEAHLAARRWFHEQIEKSGLEFRTDGAGNHSAVLACGPKDARTFLLGSHLDSVPNGGRFDGALGVVAAFEVLRTIKEAGLKLKFQLEAIDFTDEEGTLVGLLGSAAIAGNLHSELLKNPRGGRQALVTGMRRAGLKEDDILNAVRPKGSLAGYLEMHIEQGKRLERMGINIGIVSAITGIWSYRLSFLGRADHAGTTPMNNRRDASLGASAFTLAARELVLKDFSNSVVNIGRMEFTPGSFNIVPECADLALEFRSPDESEFKRLNTALIECAKTQARHFGLELNIEFLGMHPPSIMNENIIRAISHACDALGLTHTLLVSGAGHDGQSLAAICPVGMIFVPSVEGASHTPRELTRWEDCVNGANVLLDTTLQLAG
jgi:N-carbamoyl-L-amino-acid hydrolase